MRRVGLNKPGRVMNAASKKHRRLAVISLLFVTLICVTWLMKFAVLETIEEYAKCYALRNSTNTTTEHIEEIELTWWDRDDNLTSLPSLVVPNIVHFFKLQKPTLSFTEMVVLLSAWCHQKPDRIIIHCDCDDLIGPYWLKVKELWDVEVRRIQLPTTVFGKPLNSSYRIFHAGDIVRIGVLREFGGIALDFDTYVVRSLDEFRHFECTIAWPEDAFLGCQIIIAHKNARFLKLYRETYHYYNGSSWYYNAGELPTSILQVLPHIIHRVPWKLGVHDLRHELYRTSWKDWTSYYSIHLLMGHRYASAFEQIEFDELNIRNYNYTFGEMARLVLFGRVDPIPDNRTVKWDYSSCRR